MEGPTGGAGRPRVRVSATPGPRRLSREASIAAAEAAGQAYKVMPHVFFSAHKVTAARELGHLAVEASQKQIDYARRRSAALSAFLVEQDVANLAARGESIEVCPPRRACPPPRLSW